MKMKSKMRVMWDIVSASTAESFAGGEQQSASSLDQAVHKQEALPNIS